MEFSKVYTLKKEVTEQQFLRNVLIGLSKDEKSPANIMNAKFGKVTEFTSEFLVLSATIEVNYSGSCGYDRTEEYQTTESKYVKEGDYYTCNGITKRATYDGRVQVDVVKTRTVTDWRPYSGTLNTSKMVVGLNKDNDDEDFSSLFLSAARQAKDENIVEEGVANVNSLAYKSNLEYCEKAARRAVSWPGNHHKDENYNCKTDVDSLECYIVPCYMVEFEYNRKRYRARGLAVGNVNEVHEVPKPDGNVESVEIIENRRKSNVNRAERPLKIKKFFTGAAVVMGIVAIYGIDGGKIYLSLGLISMVISIIIAIVVHIKVKRDVDTINALAYIEEKKLKNIKVNNLVDALKRLNLPALSASEKNGISSKDSYK